MPICGVKEWLETTRCTYQSLQWTQVCRQGRGREMNLAVEEMRRGGMGFREARPWWLRRVMLSCGSPGMPELATESLTIAAPLGSN